MAKPKFLWFAFFIASILSVAQARAESAPPHAKAEQPPAKAATVPAPRGASKPVPAPEPSAEKLKDLKKHPEARSGKGHL